MKEKLYESFLEELEKFKAEDFKEHFILLKGNRAPNLIFSCPHAVSQTREGNIKLADINTGPLGVILNKLGYSVLIRTKNHNDDPNYDKKSKYKEFLSKYISENNIQAVIDLHGMSKKRDMSFCLGTSFGNLLDFSIQITNDFFRIADKYNIENVRTDFPFAAFGDNTVSKTIAKKNKIQTLQIEINSKMYDSEENFKKTVSVLNDFAILFSKSVAFKKDKYDIKEFHKLDKLLGDKKYFPELFYQQNCSSSVLVAAPHACSSNIQGIKKASESHAGALALLLGKEKKCDTFIKASETDFDSNEMFCGEILNRIKNYNFYLELHVMNSERPQDVILVCDNGQSLKNNLTLVSKTMSVFINSGIKNISIDYPFNPYQKSKPFSKIYLESGVPSLQIIFNEKLFNSTKKVNKILSSLSQIIFIAELS